MGSWPDRPHRPTTSTCASSRQREAPCPGAPPSRPRLPPGRWLEARFEVGQMVLVDQGLPGKIIAVERRIVPGILGLLPLETWVYVVKAEEGGDQQTDVPEYNLVALATE